MLTSLPLATLTMPGGIFGLAVWCIIIAAVAMIVVVACRAMGVAIPAWVIQVMWILIIAVVCIAAIRFVAGL